MTVVASDKDTVRVQQREDDAAHSNENGSQRVAHPATTALGITAPHTSIDLFPFGRSCSSHIR